MLSARPLALAVAALLATTPSAIAQTPAPGDPGTSPALLDAGLIPVRKHAPSIQLNIIGATKRNVTDQVLPGYCKPWALLRANAAKALARAHYALRKKGIGLKVYDAYRPVRATNALVAWAINSGHPEYVGTKIARRSNHNLGSAVDVSLFATETGTELNMGADVDDLDDSSITTNAKGKALANRLRMKAALEREGFRNYSQEWWHYDFHPLGPRRIDVPLGC